MSRLWFPSTNIPDAIAESRRLSRLFVVYISGDDDVSHTMDEMWEDERVLGLCGSTCVSIKLSANSDSCKQFSAIYPVLTIPSAYFIDSTGKIVEALAVQPTVDEFVSKIDAVTKPYRTEEEATINAHQSETEPESSKPKKLSDSSSGSSATENKPEELPDSSSSSLSTEKTDDGQHVKTERRRKTTEERVEDEVKDETKQEKERREWGKNIQKLREAQKEAKMKQDIEERKRNKLEEQAARERVRRQIEQDKLDRAARFQQEKNERAQAAAKKQSQKEEAENEERIRQQEERNLNARIQFRLPDGSTLVEKFAATDTLQSATEFIVSQNYSDLRSPQSFELATAFPRKTFPSSEYSRTFASLGLAPSASLVVLPRRDMSLSSSQAASDGVWSLLLFVIMIPVRLLTLLWSFIAGQSRNQRVESEINAPTSPQSHSGTVDPSLDVRRRRNMTRLQDVKGDDDDNATWNGNSTQQM